MDCGGGTPAYGVIAFDGSPNNDGLMLCGAELVVDVLGSNKGFGTVDTVSGFLSVAAINEDGWLVVFSGTARGFPKANGRLGLLLGTVAVVDAGLSTEILPNENGEGVICSFAGFWKENDPMIGLLSAFRNDVGDGIEGPLSPLGLPNVNGAGESPVVSDLPIGGNAEEVAPEAARTLDRKAGSLPGLGSALATGFSNTLVEVEVEGGKFAPVSAVPLSTDRELEFRAGGGIFDFPFNTGESAKNFGTKSFVDEVAVDEVEEVGFSKLKGCNGKEAVSEAPKIDVDSGGRLSFGAESILRSSDGVDPFEREKGSEVIGGSLAFWRSPALGKGAGVCKSKLGIYQQITKREKLRTTHVFCKCKPWWNVEYWDFCRRFFQNSSLLHPFIIIHCIISLVIIRC